MKTKMDVEQQVDIEEIELPLEPAADYLMWVGSVFYPTVDIYIEEALRLGFCKRLGRVPHGLIPGESRIFLAHDDGIVGEGFIFGYFVPDELEYLCKSPDDIPEQLFDRVLAVMNWSSEPERECGTRNEGVYIVLRTKPVKGHYVIFDEPRKLEAFDPGRKHFRGMLQINYGEAVADKVTKSQTMIPPSRLPKPEPKASSIPWTLEEDEEVLLAMTNGSSMAKAAQRLAYKTGRRKSSIIYRFKFLMSAFDEENNEEEDDD